MAVGTLLLRGGGSKLTLTVKKMTSSFGDTFRKESSNQGMRRSGETYVLSHFTHSRSTLCFSRFRNNFSFTISNVSRTETNTSDINQIEIENTVCKIRFFLSQSKNKTFKYCFILSCCRNGWNFNLHREYPQIEMV